MILSNTVNYAIRILVFMAQNSSEKYTSKNLIEKLKISDKYLRRLMTKLSKSGFIKSVQGANGGYYFDKNIEDIFIFDVIEAIDGIDKYSACILGFADCSDNHPCALHSRWKRIREEIFKMFKETSLKDLIFKNDLIKF